MATFTGTVTSTSRQGSGAGQTRTFTLTNPGPPQEEKTFTCDEDYFDDAKHAGGKDATVTYEDSTPPPQACSGFKVNH